MPGSKEVLRLVQALCGLILISAVSGAAQAATVGTAVLDFANNGKTLGDPVTVTIDRVGSLYTVTVEGGDAFTDFGFNLGGSVENFTISSEDSAAGWSLTPGGATFDGFGSFDYGLKLEGGGTDTLLVFSFNSSIENVLDLFIKNLKSFQGIDGFYFSVKIAGSTSGGGFGFAATELLTPVPLPGSLWLLASGLLGFVALGAMLRRRTARGTSALMTVRFATTASFG
jgi:hypothetical protein